MSKNTEYNLGININVSGKYEKQLKELETRLENISKIASKSNNSIRNSNKSMESSYEGYEQKIKEVIKANEKLSKMNDKLSTSNKKQRREINKLEKEMKGLKNSTDSTAKSSDNWLSSYSKSLKLAITSVGVWGVATTAIYGTKRALEVTITTMKEIDTRMTELRKVMNPATTDFQEMKETATDMAIEFGRSIDNVIDGMADWGRQGFKQKEVIELTRASLLASNVAEMQVADSVKYITSAVRQFGIEASKSSIIVDKWNEVSNNFGVTAQDLAQSISVAGSASREAGVSIDQLIGLTTALTESTARSGNEVGRALRTMFARMQKITDEASTKPLNEFEEVLSNLPNAIPIRETENKFRNMFDILGDLSGQWEELDDVTRKHVANVVGGTRRYSTFNALMTNFDRAVEATNTSMNSLGSALAENETYMGSMEAQFQQVVAQAQAVTVALGDAGMRSAVLSVSDVIEGFFKVLENMINGFSDMPKVLKTLLVGGTSLIALKFAIDGIVVGVVSLNKVLKTTTLLSNGWLQALTAIVTIGSLVAYTYGRQQEKLEEIKASRESISKLQDRNAELSYNEVYAIQEQINAVDELFRKYEEAPRNAPLFGNGGATKKDIEQEIISDYGFLFPDIDDFSSGIARMSYIRQEVEKLSESINNVGDRINATANYSVMSSETFISEAESVGKKLQTEVIDKLIDIQKEMDAISEKTLIKRSQLGIQLLNDLINPLEFQKQVEGLYKTDLNSLFNLQMELEVSQDDIKKLENNREALLKEIDKRLESGVGDEEQLRNIQRNLQATMNEGADSLYRNQQVAISQLIQGTIDKYKEQMAVVQDLEEENKKVVDSINLANQGYDKTLSKLDKYKNDMNTARKTLEFMENNIGEETATGEVIKDEDVSNMEFYIAWLEDVIKLEKMSIAESKVEDKYKNLFKNIRESIDDFNIGDVFNVDNISTFDNVVSKVDEFNNKLIRINREKEKVNKQFEDGIIEEDRFNLEIKNLKNMELEVEEILETLKTEPATSFLDKISTGYEKVMPQQEKFNKEISRYNTYKEVLNTLNSKNMISQEEYNQAVKELNALIKDSKQNLEEFNNEQFESDWVSSFEDRFNGVINSLQEFDSGQYDTVSKATEGISKFEEKMIDVNRELSLAEIKRRSGVWNEEQYDIATDRLNGFKEELIAIIELLQTEPKQNLFDSINNQYMSTLDEEDRIKRTLLNQMEQLNDLHVGYADGTITLAEYEQQKSRLNAVIDNTTQRIKDLKSEDIDEVMSNLSNAYESTLSPVEKLNNQISDYVSLENQLKEARDKELISANEYTKYLKIIELLIGNINEEIKELDKNKVNDFLSGIDSQFDSTKSKMQQMNEELVDLELDKIKLEELVSSGDLSSSDYIRYLNKIDEIIAQINENINKENENNFLSDLEDILKNSDEYIDSLSMDEILGISDAKSKLLELSNELVKLGISRKDFASGNYTSEQLETAMEEFGMNEKEIKEFVEKLNKYIKETKYSWGYAVGEGINYAINDIDLDVDNLTTQVEKILQGLSKSIFDNEDLKSDFELMLGDLGLSENWTKGIMEGVESLASGGSIGGSLFKGVGAGLTAINPLVGGIVSAIGGIGESLWGGVSGEDNLKAVDRVNDSLENASSSLKEFDINMKSTKASIEDVASGWEQFWGGHDYQAKNLEEAQNDLEEMEKTLNRIKNTFSSLSQGFAQSIKQSTNYSEFFQFFKQNIGQAIQDAIITKLVESNAIQDMLKGISGQIDKAISDDYQISQSELDSILSKARETRSQVEEVMPALRQIEQELGLEYDQSVNQSFQAGSTTNITYHNTFAVNSQVYLGDEESARESAEMLAPYILEYLDR